MKSESASCSGVSDPLRPHGLYSPWDSLGQNTGVGSLSLLQGIFPTQELNRDLLHCMQILYQLSYQGKPFQSNGELSEGLSTYQFKQLKGENKKTRNDKHIPQVLCWQEIFFFLLICLLLCSLASSDR